MKHIAVFLCALFSFPVAAQYPDRPVTMLTGYPAGGLVDVVARLVAEGMKAKFPKGLVVQIRPGAAGSVAVTELVRAQPDGYTFVLTPHSALVIAAQLQNLAYKTPDDYLPFINVVSYYPMIAVRTESSYQNINQLVADAKANLGKVRVGSPGEGTSSHLNLEEFMRHTGTRMIHAPYQGWGHSSPASSREWWTASACACWSRSSRSATRCFPTCRRRRNSAGT